MKKEKGKLTTWSEFKDEHFGLIGTSERDAYERDVAAFVIGMQ